MTSPGLRQLTGKEAFSRYLESLSDAPVFEMTGYGYEIHEDERDGYSSLGKRHFQSTHFHIPYSFCHSDSILITPPLSLRRYVKSLHPSWQAYLWWWGQRVVLCLYIHGIDSTWPVQANQEGSESLFDHLCAHFHKENKMVRYSCWCATAILPWSRVSIDETLYLAFQH